MQKILEKHLDSQILRSDLPLMMVGETGTGKTSLARAAHDHSGHGGRFVGLNLSAFSPQLIESEVFGHVKGAFTGASQDKKGAISLSAGGTLFLDEIDSIPTSLQVKLLTFLDDGAYRPVGSDFQKRVQTRLIFASGRNPYELVKRGLMRKDFFFRLSSGHTLLLPALREQKELIAAYLNQWEEMHGLSFERSLREFYLNYSWPGNYRQLSSHLRMKKTLSPKPLIEWSMEDRALKEMDIEGEELIEMNFERSLDEMKQKYCVKVFETQERNMERSLSVLKVSRNTLRKILKEAGVISSPQ